MTSLSIALYISFTVVSPHTEDSLGMQRLMRILVEKNSLYDIGIVRVYLSSGVSIIILCLLSGAVSIKVPSVYVVYPFVFRTPR